MANDVTFQCAEYENALPYWDVVDDACAGSIRVKAAREKHLPKPNPADTSDANKTRYDQLLKRTLYVNFSGHTLRGMVGAAFTKAPQIVVPTVLDFVKSDIDGAGLSVTQQAKTCLSNVLKGRAILLVDYPPKEQKQGKKPSALDEALEHVRPTTVLINKRNLKDWKTEKIGSIHKLVLAPIFEQDKSFGADGFGEVITDQYRVLRLTKIDTQYVYTQEIWRQVDGKPNEWELYKEPWVIYDGTGKPWDYIPIEIVGPENNDLRIDPSPMYDMSEVNLAHYRNSANYEDGIYMHGEGTLVLDVGEISQEDFEKANPRGVALGASGGIVLGRGGNGQILQMQANSAAKEGMDQKEKQMVALGARMFIPGAVVKTVAEAESKSEVEHSVLSLAAENVSSAYTNCFKHMLRFMGLTGEATFDINQDFTRLQADSPMLKELRETWLAGGIPDADYFRKMKKYDLIDPDKSDEDIKEELAAQPRGVALTEEF